MNLYAHHWLRQEQTRKRNGRKVTYRIEVGSHLVTLAPRCQSINTGGHGDRPDGLGGDLSSSDSLGIYESGKKGKPEPVSQSRFSRGSCRLDFCAQAHELENEDKLEMIVSDVLD